jgi:hypothetical protein
MQHKTLLHFVKYFITPKILSYNLKLYINTMFYTFSDIVYIFIYIINFTQF